MQTLTELNNEFISTLESAVAESGNFGVVENPASIDPETYKLNHPKVAFLIFTGSVKFFNNDGESSITQKQNNQIEVWVVCRKTQKNLPEEHIDFVINTFRGRIAEPNNVKSSIYPEVAEFIYEKDGVWFYRIGLVAPNLNQITF